MNADANVVGMGASLILAMMLFIVPAVVACAAVYGIYLVLTVPVRRAERGRLFLDLLELGLKDGRTPENAITDAASSHDNSLGSHFHDLAAQIRSGRKLGAALDAVPRIAPPEVRAMLQAGERIGSVGKVLPACRRLLGDSLSQMRGAINYVVLLAFVVTPGMVFIPVILRVKVLPQFRLVFEGMLNSSQLPAFTRLVMAESDWMIAALTAALLAVWLLMLAYVCGPRLREGLNRIFPGGPDWVLYHLPWRRKRLQRDFSTMLALLLDAHVPEAEAVTLAAGATANDLLRRRATRVCGQLQTGVRLPEAIRAMDDSPELQWRLTNAIERGSGFLAALDGWQESLDARAFQLEQAAAQIVSTLLVLLNGAIVASVVIGMFLPLIALINHIT